MRYVVLDFESASSCDLLKSGAWRYSMDFSTFITHIGFKVVVDNIPRPTRVLKGAECNRVDPELHELACDPSVMFLCHNSSFEMAMWKYHMVPLGYPELSIDRWHDTMASAAMHSLPLGLDPLTNALDLPIKKDMEGHRLMLKMCKPDKEGGWSQHTPENMQREAEYNVTDVDGQFGVYLATQGLGAEERQIWLTDQIINQRGILIDTNFVHACVDVLNQVRQPMTEEFRQITGGLNPTQREKVLNWVNEQGVPLGDMRKGTLDAMLDPDDEFGMEAWDQIGTAPMPPNVHRVLTLRRSLASSSVAKLERMLRCAGPDGRVRYTMQYHGAGTGRWAGRLIQIQNYPRGEIQERQGLTPEILADAIMTRNVDTVRELWGDDIFSAIISSLRSCIVPDRSKGRILAVGDYAQVEARNVLSFAGHHDRASEFDTTDAYAELGALIFKHPVNKKDNPRERQVGKNALLGSGFGLGPLGFQAKFAPNEPFELAELAIRTYRTDFAPMVPKFWYALYQASVDAVWCNQARTYSFAGIEFRKEGDFLTMRLPSGRKIWYHRPERDKSFNPNTGLEYPAWTYMSYQGKKSRRHFMWYGQLMNNLVQGSAADLIRNALLLCEANNMPVVFTAHDEIVCEVQERPGLAETLKQIMEYIPAWARERRFNVKAETDVMVRYRK
jgi:DNA polymerase bacteriophage-type